MLSRRALLARIARRTPPARFNASSDGRRASLVVVFLRGGADGLSLVPPIGDDAYSRARPTLAIRDGIALDDRFALHPALEPLVPLYRDGRMAVVHAVGTDDATRSHFEAQDRMEHAGSPGTGWLARLARALDETGGAAGSGLSSVTLGPRVTESLRGAPAVSAFESVAECTLRVAEPAPFLNTLGALYATDQALLPACRDALETLDRLGNIGRRPASAAAYPDHPFGRRMRELSSLFCAGIDTRIAAVDFDGWDTHFVQADGLAANARVLARSLSAFVDDLRAFDDSVTILVMTEFGRRLYENTSLGTDHGRGSVMFAIGAGVRGGPRGHALARSRRSGARRSGRPSGDDRHARRFRRARGQTVWPRRPSHRRAHRSPARALRGLTRAIGAAWLRITHGFRRTRSSELPRPLRRA